MMMTVDDILAEKRDTRIVTVRMSDSVAKAALVMKRENISCVLVTDDCPTEGRTLVGVFSERDVTRALLEYGAATPEMPLAAFLEREMVCCLPSDTVVTAMHLMNVHQIRHLPVMEDYALVGLISATDLMRHCLNEAAGRGDLSLSVMHGELAVLR